MIKSRLKEWKASFDTNVLDQLAALNTNEYEALDVTRNYGEGTLEWIQFGDYRTIVERIEHLKARTLTMVMSGVPQPPPRVEGTEEEKEEKVLTHMRVWWNEFFLVFQ